MNCVTEVNSIIASLIKAAFLYSNPQTKIRGINLDTQLPKNLPSVIEIKRVIPSHCFVPSTCRSLLYALKDVVQILFAWVLLWYLLPLTNWIALKVLMIFVYWGIQGTFFMGLFVMGHDCGHGSFSKYRLLNDVVGTISHAFLFVPYYQWKLTHQNHHKFTGNMDKDEVFYPARASQKPSINSVLPGFGYGIGWFTYLFIGYFPRRVSHFNLFDEMFRGHEVACTLSLLTYGMNGTLCYWFYLSYGFKILFVFYLAPLFIYGSYMVIVTFLHHSEVNIPWYADQNWNYVKGQLSTIDRNYGLVHHAIHCIGTHQMHHMFTKIPHYHLEEATRHFRSAFPELVKSCDEPILSSFVRMFKKYNQQQVVADNALEVYYK
ncbi:hypothetical protein HELRODRAFT_71572 [Helobdella robusta]|uniref:Fatty acid desaturase domain-containing protein n=1 Tax=Helobdella robusta TaxID=6412 RepID=T1G0N6_HELRO|nr:hypothetical protein HELRODRAFT_71572 [Helobdella robusta]ESO11545.1 hypothetical protein HELRODRAFT_71572 [Helobdella robusta]